MGNIKKYKIGFRFQVSGFKNLGFTLLEILVVMSIVTVLVGVSIGVYGVLRNRSALDVDAQKIVSALRLARNRTLASQNTSSHGVHFETSDDSFTNFEGSTYNPVDPNNKTIFLNSRVEFLNIQLSGSVPDSVFSRLSGQTLQDGFIEIADTSDSAATRIICIETSGAVRILSPKDTSASCNAPILEYIGGTTDADLASFPNNSGFGDPAQSFTTGDEGSGGGLIAIDKISTSSTNGGSSITVSHTTSGLNRLMLVGVSLNNDDSETVSSLTYNGTNLTLVGTQTESDDARIEIWQLVAPDVGTYDVIVTFNTSLKRQGIAGVMTFIGVNQASPLGVFAGDNNNSGTNATVNVSSSTGEVVFGVVSCESCGSLTEGPGQSEHWYTIEGGGKTLGAGSTETGATTVTTSWSMGSSDDWAVGGVSIKPVPEGSSIEVASIDLYLKRLGTPSDIFLEIRDTSTVGNVLGRSLIVSGAGLPTSLSWVRFEFPRSVQLSVTTQYFMRLRSLPSSTIAFSGGAGTIIWGYEHSAVSPPAYSGGDVWRFVGANNNPLDQGQRLGPADQYDFSFRLFSGEQTPSTDSRVLDFDLGSTLRGYTNITLSFSGGSTVQNVTVASYMNSDSTEFDWQGIIDVSGSNQTIRIHSLYIDANDTILHVHRDGDLNDVSLDINMDSVDLVDYTASGIATKGSTIDSMIYR